MGWRWIKEKKLELSKATTLSAVPQARGAMEALAEMVASGIVREQRRIGRGAGVTGGSAGYCAGRSPLCSGVNDCKTVESLKNLPGVISIRAELTYLLRTTRSPTFLGLTARTGAWKQTNLGEGIVISVLDTGHYPRHPSFNLNEMSPPPSGWKATACRRPFAPTRSSPPGASSWATNLPRRSTSMATGPPSGDFVRIAGGARRASGMAPRANLAIYRVCIARFCRESDIVAGLDAAIEDSMDVLSMSLGNRVVHDGESVYQPTNFSSKNLLPLVYCPGSLAGFDVRGKIVQLDAGNTSIKPRT
ncbi:subtilase family protein [Striga asiatica]|uniref:Subtilase family protein n=1 Tax=Striga asiatica TaxID=4170 RepID=A0A5A7QJE9_STRAF|nr:subtilase family protein [Striga asiatica]